MGKLKIAALAVLVLLAVIVIFQNTDMVQTKFLFITVSMPQVVLLLGTLLIGFAMGVLTAGRIERRRREPK